MNRESKKYVYEFIPFEKIGPFSLTKKEKIDSEGSDARYFMEDSLNSIKCIPKTIDNPNNREGIPKDELIITIQNHQIKINCYYDEVIKSLKEYTTDFVEHDVMTENIPSKIAYSKKLGIYIYAQKMDDFYCIWVLRFMGKEETERYIEFIKRDVLKSITINSRLSKFVMPENTDKEYIQKLVLYESGKIEFEGLNFENKVIRREITEITKEEIKSLFDSIKDNLSIMELNPISKDGDTWEVEINNGNENKKYYGNISKDDDHNKLISIFIRDLVKVDNLILLDGNK